MVGIRKIEERNLSMQLQKSSNHKETEQPRGKGQNNYKTAKTPEQNAILNPYLSKLFLF